MNKLLDYKDSVILISTTQDEYGDDFIDKVIPINGLFLQGTSQNEISHTDMISTDAHIYLDIDNPFVQENAYRLEGMYLVADLLGLGQSESWYKIARVKIGWRKLLENDINNVHCFLTKCEALGELSNGSSVQI